MALRILHTSDWHLGAVLESAPRYEEQSRFLDWLLEHLDSSRIDLLIIAGDVFQYAQPSTDAQRMYYRFLARVGTETHVRQVLVIGGNHDSPSRLDAPREVLEVLNVQVVGGFHRMGEDLTRYLCPVRGENGGVEAVVAAVPFVHEFRLGVRTSDRSAAEITRDFHTAFRGLYSELADYAEATFPGAPLLATGHLACSGTQPGDYQSQIHQIGTIGALSGDIFDARFRYVALGHIHRMFPIKGSSAFYCGTPVPMTLGEARTPRYVLQVTLDTVSPPEVEPEGQAGAVLLPILEPSQAGESAEPHGTSRITSEDSDRSQAERLEGARRWALPARNGERLLVEAVQVPPFRALLEMEGTLEAVSDRLATLTTDLPLPPYIYIRLLVDEYRPDAELRLSEVLETRPTSDRPRLVDVRQRRVDQGEVLGEKEGENTPRTLFTPEQVFIRMYRQKHESAPSEALLIAFRTAVSLVEQDDMLEEYLHEVPQD